jgi:hypothetical protein
MALPVARGACHVVGRLHDTTALQRIYEACRAELIASNEAVPTALEAIARQEMGQ